MSDGDLSSRSLEDTKRSGKRGVVIFVERRAVVNGVDG